MDGLLAIERNRVTLKRILAELVAIAGLTCGGGTASTIRRDLLIAILRVLRPAEAAARRLIIALAWDIPVPELPQPAARDTGRAGRNARKAAPEAEMDRLAPAPLSLVDPLSQPFRHRRKSIPDYAMPRISLPSEEQRPWRPSPPSCYDQVSAKSVSRRFAALAAALDDLPRHAQRFARWSARHEQRRKLGRICRLFPLNLRRPPGGRLAHWDPDVWLTRRKSCRIREVDEVLAHANALAGYALERRHACDSSLRPNRENAPSPL